MADVKQIEVNGVTYDIHDATARSQIANLQQSVSHKVDLYGPNAIPSSTSRALEAHIGTGGDSSQHVDITVDDNGTQYSLVASDNETFLHNESTGAEPWVIKPTVERGKRVETGTGGDASQHWNVRISDNGTLYSLIGSNSGLLFRNSTAGTNLWNLNVNSLPTFNDSISSAYWSAGTDKLEYHVNTKAGQLLLFHISASQLGLFRWNTSISNWDTIIRFTP